MGDEAATVAKVAKENLKHTEKKEAKAEAEVAKAITSGDPKQAENAKKDLEKATKAEAQEKKSSADKIKKVASAQEKITSKAAVTAVAAGGAAPAAPPIVVHVHIDGKSCGKKGEEAC